MKTLKQQLERLDLSIRKTDSVTDLVKKQRKLSDVISNNVDEFIDTHQEHIGYIEMGKHLLDLSILKLSEATMNGEKEVDNKKIDLLKSKVWRCVEEEFYTEDEQLKLDEAYGEISLLHTLIDATKEPFGDNPLDDYSKQLISGFRKEIKKQKKIISSIPSRRFFMNV